MLIDTVNEQILFQINRNDGIVSYTDTRLSSAEYTSLCIKEFGEYLEENEDFSQLDLNDSFEEDFIDYSYEITKEEIDKKIDSCKNISHDEKEKLKQLVKNYKEVFEKRPGLLAAYEHALIDKDKEAPFYTKPYPIPIHYRERVKK